MPDFRFIHSPIFVLFAGLAAALLGTILVYTGAEGTSAELSRSVSVGAFTACGAATMATWQRFASRKASERLNKAAHDAKHDSLTGLANRTEVYRALDESLIQAKRDETVFGVLFMDLDRFKVINDSMGHDAGDELLKIVADRLRAATRSSDVVARLGGDEFVVICGGLTNGESVEAVARQVLKRLGEPVALNGRRQTISASIGIAIADSSEGRDPDELIRDADAAMYKAKRDRIGYCVFDDAQRSLLIDRLDIERDLGRAIDDKQLRVFYQPIVVAATGELYGFEALVRWEHPERGFISPAEFLPIAEDARLMANIGELVLREACAQAAVWNHLSERASGLRISVNLAEQQLTNPDLPAIVAEILGWSGLGADQLVLEITEDVMVEHLDGLTTLRNLRNLGLHLAIDDFGTGQSSLSYLKQFDMASTLKIDRSFVRDMNEGAADLAIIEAIVAMATALNMSVVAEGVEDYNQVRALSALGVQLMQGFLFARPQPAEAVGDLDHWLSQQSSPGLTSTAVGQGLTQGRLRLPTVTN
ncbi:MAG: EAL domain-containing protein [Actinomycetia bacterium]|nr:EAL domain-containing protein [Actinomycetes bacterium]